MSAWPDSNGPAAAGRPGRHRGPPSGLGPGVGPGFALGRGPHPGDHRRPRWGRRLVRLAILLVAVVVVASAGTYVWADTQLDRQVDLGELTDRPPRGSGTTYLIVGSDSRDGLSEKSRKDLHTGSSGGGRTDSMLLLHTGRSGTTLVSLPRDSWVTLPPFVRPQTGVHYGASKNKLNAAYAWGGPRLLVRTVERNTGVRVDNYAEMGFGGFVGVVDAVGGVRMCVHRHIEDQKSGLDLDRGCHTLDGGQALAFVRQRHQEKKGDLGRTRNQQEFLAALARKAATPGVALNPLKAYRTMRAGLDTLVVDQGMGLPDLARMARAMRGVTAGEGKRVSVPVADRGVRTSKGDALLWDRRRARKLFTEIREGAPVTVGDGTS